VGGAPGRALVGAAEAWPPSTAGAAGVVDWAGAVVVVWPDGVWRRLAGGRGRRLGESGAGQRKSRGGGEHGDLGFHQ
jgi:hypothetical protein